MTLYISVRYNGFCETYAYGTLIVIVYRDGDIHTQRGALQGDYNEVNRIFWEKY